MRSVDETISLGESLGRSFVGGLQIGLVGPLGAGKTHLVKGMAAGNAMGDPRRPGHQPDVHAVARVRRATAAVSRGPLSPYGSTRTDSAGV
ncbi:MAG: tRNA (adenosine(37)-N6)-threonylcarbamoyltransferase complex ATPase subunit type 1 TsaE [Planctomycetes bacterium]|nr:tRNA (adenosine(37)-N6)-threonylcarbamoyltransferase complex ATPase subunit type 1 TsaE [Planctomycetota bacterium]